MSDIRTKLAAFAPEFVQVLEELEARVSELDAWRECFRVNEVALRNAQDDLAVRVRSLELGAELYAQSMQEALRQRDERIDTLVAGCNSHTRRIEALERPGVAVRYEQLTPTQTIHVEFEAVHLRELVLAARDAWLALEANGFDRCAIELRGALQHFEAVK